MTRRETGEAIWQALAWASSHVLNLGGDRVVPVPLSDLTKQEIESSLPRRNSARASHQTEDCQEARLGPPDAA